MLKEPVVALMGAGFLKQGFVNVMAIRAFQDSTTRGFDTRLASLHERLLHGHRQTAPRRIAPRTGPSRQGRRADGHPFTMRGGTSGLPKMPTRCRFGLEEGAI